MPERGEITSGRIALKPGKSASRQMSFNDLSFVYSYFAEHVYVIGIDAQSINAAIAAFRSQKRPRKPAEVTNL
jgi:hypothetical protein